MEIYSDRFDSNFFPRGKFNFLASEVNERKEEGRFLKTKRDDIVAFAVQCFDRIKKFSKTESFLLTTCCWINRITYHLPRSCARGRRSGRWSSRRRSSVFGRRWFRPARWHPPKIRKGRPRNPAPTTPALRRKGEREFVRKESKGTIEGNRRRSFRPR